MNLDEAATCRAREEYSAILGIEIFARNLQWWCEFNCLSEEEQAWVIEGMNINRNAADAFWRCILPMVVSK